MLCVGSFEGDDLPGEAQFWTMIARCKSLDDKPAIMLCGGVRGCRALIVRQGARMIQAGAALDVLPQEPPPAGHPLLDTPNVILTPPSAYYSLEAAQNVVSWPRKDAQSPGRRRKASLADVTRAGASQKATRPSFQAIAGSAKDQLGACFVSEALKATISLARSSSGR